MLNSDVNWLLFWVEATVRKSSDDLFLIATKEKLETFAKICVSASLEIMREYPTAKVRNNRLFGN